MIPILGCAWVVMTLVGIGVMGVDKAKARKGAYRIAESTLFLIACMGGSVGVWAGMYLFRHKTKHAQFVLGIPCIIALQAYCLFRLSR